MNHQENYLVASLLLVIFAAVSIYQLAVNKTLRASWIPIVGTVGLFFFWLSMPVVTTKIAEDHINIVQTYRAYTPFASERKFHYLLSEITDTRIKDIGDADSERYDLIIVTNDGKEFPILKSTSWDTINAEKSRLDALIQQSL